MKLVLDKVLFNLSWEYILLLSILLYFILTQLIFVSEDHSLSKNLKVLPLEIINVLSAKFNNNLNFDKYAYVQYATDFDYLNLAIINFIVLRRSSTKIPNLVVLFNRALQEDKNRFEGLENLSLRYSLTLKPIPIIENVIAESPTWSKSFTKFHIFNEVEYDRIVYFDADSMLLHTQENDNLSAANNKSNVPGNLDELFSIPEIIDIALPQAYWLTKHTKASGKIKAPDGKRYLDEITALVNEVSKSVNDRLIFEKLPSLLVQSQKLNHRNNFFATQVMVIKPSNEIFNELKKYVHNPWLWSLHKRHALRNKSDYDMEILNKFIDNVLQVDETFKVGILPHKVYGVLTGEFREPLHESFISEPQFLPFTTSELNNQWRPIEIMQNIKLIHFSDSPIPKPWEGMNNFDFYNEFRIYCHDADFDADLYNALFPTSWKPRLTTDCDSVNIWNWIMEEYQKLHNELWMV